MQLTAANVDIKAARDRFNTLIEGTVYFPLMKLDQDWIDKIN